MKDYFCGWYFKCQSGQHTLAVIPSVHRSKDEKFCSVQLITDENAWTVRYPYAAFRKQGQTITIGGNRFSPEGITLNLRSPGLSAAGSIRFGQFLPIRYDIMGPFCYVPFMECRHSVLSMKHAANGKIDINGTRYSFYNGAGYLEGDRGRSFPKEYAWTQCCFRGGSLMLSVADIPLGGFHFTGIIGIIYWHGKEYRLATYLGAKAVLIHGGEITVQQGALRFTAKLLEQKAQPLRAPQRGAMTRTIHESASCLASYCFQKNGATLFSFQSPQASFEYEYPDAVAAATKQDFCS